MNHISQAAAEALTRDAANAGKVVELGWIGALLYVVPVDASAIQVAEMRKAFFLGADHVFHSIMTMMDPGTDETPADLDRMSKLQRELAEFRKQVTTR